MSKYEKPDWMPLEDWQQIRVETTKENIRAGGQLVDTQETSVEFFKVKCTACGRTFYEYEALPHCPHCAAKIEPKNIGESMTKTLHIDTRTGAIKIITP